MQGSPVVKEWRLFEDSARNIEGAAPEHGGPTCHCWLVFWSLRRGTHLRYTSTRRSCQSYSNQSKIALIMLSADATTEEPSIMFCRSSSPLLHSIRREDCLPRTLPHYLPESTAQHRPRCCAELNVSLRGQLGEHRLRQLGTHVANLGLDGKRNHVAPAGS